ncbi:MAG: hypothetical protein ACYTEQ_27920 [Planctomycetota bacterium]|jgi:hypothetical protein
MRNQIVFSCFIIHFWPITANCVIFSSSELWIDFRDRYLAKAKATWSESNYITVTEEGLGWDRKEGSSRDMWFQTTPLAIGLSWRPAQSANLVVELEPAARPVRLSTGKTRHPSAGAMFVRHSPDGRHWSSWQTMQLKDSQDKQKSKYEYTAVARVPRKNREKYLEYNRQYQQLDVPWKSDAEALVKWIVERDPNFFEKRPPFIGYLQFLYETSLFGEQRIARFHATAAWAVSGLHDIPRDPNVQRSRYNIPWRYRPPETSGLLTQQDKLLAERDKLLAEADARIRSGLVELSRRFPHMRNARGWDNAISNKSETGTISISLHHTNTGKARSVFHPIPPQEVYGVLVVVRPRPAEPTQLAMFSLYPKLGLVGQVGTSAQNAELRTEFKKLVDDALAPTVVLNEKADGKGPAEKIRE